MSVPGHLSRSRASVSHSLFHPLVFSSAMAEKRKDHLPCHIISPKPGSQGRGDRSAPVRRTSKNNIISAGVFCYGKQRICRLSVSGSLLQSCGFFRNKNNTRSKYFLSYRCSSFASYFFIHYPPSSISCLIPVCYEKPYVFRILKKATAPAF